MLNYTILFVPVLFGLLLLTALCRAVIFWQMERTPKVFCFFMVFASFCFLYLVSSLRLPAFWMTVGRSVLLLALIFGNWYQCSEIFAFMRKKLAGDLSVTTYSPAAAAVSAFTATPEHSTLHDLAKVGAPVILVATTKDAPVSSDATPKEEKKSDAP